MLTITVPATELFDERTQEFVTIKEQTLLLEHSLVSLSKWESKWHKAYMGKDKKTTEEVLDYIKCMTVTQNVKPEVYLCLAAEQITQIKDYIEDAATATVIYHDKKQRPSRETITSEIIYYWMTVHNIPFECQKWHINRLLTLIQVCNVKNTKQKPKSKREIFEQNRRLNETRRAQANTRG